MTAPPINQADATTESPARAAKSRAAFRTISEVADELDVAQHVLRFWESKFPQVRPLKRGGGRRYYRPEDVDLLRQIRTLLYDEGYTIKGAEKLLRQRRSKTPAPERPAAVRAAAPLKRDNEEQAREAPADTNQAVDAPSTEQPAAEKDQAGLMRIRDRLMTLKTRLDALRTSS